MLRRKKNKSKRITKHFLSNKREDIFFYPDSIAYNFMDYNLAHSVNRIRFTIKSFESVNQKDENKKKKERKRNKKHSATPAALSEALTFLQMQMSKQAIFLPSKGTAPAIPNIDCVYTLLLSLFSSVSLPPFYLRFDFHFN